MLLPVLGVGDDSRSPSRLVDDLLRLTSVIWLGVDLDSTIVMDVPPTVLLCVTELLL